eukprot:768571-Hanusia_phi.AAC.2
MEGKSAQGLLLLVVLVVCSSNETKGTGEVCCTGFARDVSYPSMNDLRRIDLPIDKNGGTLSLRGYGPKTPGGGSKQKAIKKIVEDKTFGLKNKKKSKTVQKYVKSVEIQAKNMVIDAKKAEMKRAKKEEAKKHEAEMAMLFNTRTENSKENTKDSNQQVDNTISGKELLEDYEYQSSVQALTRSDGVHPMGELTVDQEIEDLRAKINESEKIPVDQAWFDEWVQKNILKNSTAAAKKGSTRIPKKSGKEIFMEAKDLNQFKDDDEVDDNWLQRQNSDSWDSAEYDTSDKKVGLHSDLA